MMTHEPVNTTVSGPTGWIRSVWCRAGIPLACGWRLALVGWVVGSTVLGQTVPTNDEPSNPIEVNIWAPVLSGEGTGATYGLEDTPDMRVAFTSMGYSRGGGSLWYTWTSPITGTVTVQNELGGGGAAYTPLLFLDRQLLPMRQNPRETLEATFEAIRGTQYLFTVVAPTRMAMPGDFGLLFSFPLSFGSPEMLQLVSPREGLVVRSGEPVEFRLDLKIVPEDLDSIEVLGAEPWQARRLWFALPPQRRSLTITPELSGVYQTSAFLRLKGGQIVGDIPARQLTVLPANDLFADRKALVGRHAEAVVTTRLGGREDGEPPLTGGPGARSVWWRWMAPGTGDVVLQVAGPFAAGRLAVYSGEQIANLARVPTTPVDGPPGTPTTQYHSVRFQARKGVEYAVVYETSDPGYSTERLFLDQPSISEMPWSLRIPSAAPDGGVVLEASGPPDSEIAVEEGSGIGAFRPLRTIRSDATGRVRVELPPTSGVATRFFQLRLP